MDDDSYEGDDVFSSDDKFYRGVVLKLSRGAQRGTIRSINGRNIPFMFAQVTLVGARRHFDDLQEGMQVRFDVSWTSKGLRVSVIRIPESIDPDTPSEGE